MRLNAEAYREIYEARERLRAFRDKVQPYPEYVTNDNIPEITPRFRPRPIDKELDQVKSGFLFLRNRFNAHLDAGKKKPRPQVTSGKPKYKDAI